MDGGAADALWDFARTVYGRPGVAPACLELQDRFGANVILLLFAAWAGAAHGIRLTDRDLDEARRAVGAWHAEVVEPLRHVRRRLKFGPKPAPDPDTGVLRAKLQALEIEAERIELAMVAATLPPGAPAPSAGMGHRRDCAAANLARIVPAPEAAPLRAVLAEAAAAG